MQIDRPDFDLITELGELAFATRLKRLADRLQRDISKVYEAMRIDFEARWFSVLYLLGQESPLPVTSIAKALRLTHPAVNQITGAMARRRLITSRRDPTDERRRLIALSAKGRETIALLTPTWDMIAAATRELLDQTAPDILSQLTGLEAQLDQSDMYARVADRIKSRQISRVEIVDYTPREKEQFRKLNYEWLERYFGVEPADEAILTDPQGKILAGGGEIFFARLDGVIVGTAALIRRDPDTYELAKMAVTEEAQGQQVGRRLAQDAIARARRKGARSLILHTSPKLKPAIALYRSLGFQTVSHGADQSEFQRNTFMMRLDLERSVA